jgi:hypothetical protein
MSGVIQVPLDLSDLERVHAFVMSAVVVDGPPAYTRSSRSTGRSCFTK